MKNREWRVVVEGVGDIGSVIEDGEDNARCAALSRFSEDGDRPRGDTSAHIFENDDFSVFAS